MTRRIKVDADILQALELTRMAKALGCTRETAFMLCFRSRLIDSVVEHEGFAVALAGVGWLILGDSESSITDYNDDHGISTKKRQRLAYARSPVGVRRTPVDSSAPDRQRGIYCIRTP